MANGIEKDDIEKWADEVLPLPPGCSTLSLATPQSEREFRGAPVLDSSRIGSSHAPAISRFSVLPQESREAKELENRESSFLQFPPSESLDPTLPTRECPLSK